MGVRQGSSGPPQSAFSAWLQGESPQVQDTCLEGILRTRAIGSGISWARCGLWWSLSQI